ncbi:MAG: hypothetical protein FWB95_05110 [Treponema sp.]|nr:hypothetical protein [Treponema sp.]
MNNNLLIKGNGICLRELQEDDIPRINEIVRVCAARSTWILYKVYKNESLIKHTLLDMNKRGNVNNDGLFGKLLKDFNIFDNMMSKKNYNLEEILRFYPDDHLFFSYGPIQSSFEESINEFINVAIDTRIEKKRRLFRLGIEIETKEGKVLIGCFTFDYNKHKTQGYQHETTGDPGIFIHPDYRKASDKRTWCETFILFTEFLKIDYPYKNDNIQISATTHRLNEETSNILSKKYGFEEFKAYVSHENFGERRFFTISYNDFIKVFSSKDNNEIKIIKGNQ